ncbi:MAG: (Fe-S)-binding protein [Chloroflexi bacterium]|nr:(Fe-S)-binding protein [Chloroflexota bacterium]
MSEIHQIITETRAYSCLDCGRCTVACPISKYDPSYSPRKVVSSTLSKNGNEMLQNSALWSCITCSMCEERCQSGVRYTELMKSLRAEAHTLGNTGQCTHGGALRALTHIMTANNLSQNRLDWVGKNLKVSAQSDVLFFVGCQPYFDVLFSDLEVRTLDAARGAIKLFNTLGIEPAVLPNERCCGHDLLWAGDTKGFARLAEHNIRALKESKAKRVVTTCPECYLTLKEEYPRYAGSLDFEVVHISQVLADFIADGKLKFRTSKKKVTYHDPCRLGRFSGIYDQPRAAITAIPGLKMTEMAHNRTSALCCGTQAWMNCGTINKQIQAERLREAKATGAGLLLTSCPKCQIHLKCAMKNEKELNIEIEDITSFAAKALVD